MNHSDGGRGHFVRAVGAVGWGALVLMADPEEWVPPFALYASPLLSRLISDVLTHEAETRQRAALRVAGFYFLAFCV